MSTEAPARISKERSFTPDKLDTKLMSRVLGGWIVEDFNDGTYEFTTPATGEFPGLVIYLADTLFQITPEGLDHETSPYVYTEEPVKVIKINEKDKTVRIKTTDSFYLIKNRGLVVLSYREGKGKEQISFVHLPKKPAA